MALAALVGAALWLGVSCASPRSSFSTGDLAPERPPNILLFLVDDLGWKDGSVLGSRFLETPRLDRMASEGTRFLQAYSNGPNCAPSRASLLSGLYTPRHGVLTVGNPARGNKAYRRLVPSENRRDLDLSFDTIPEVLAGAGYRSAIVGKYHVGEDPREQGFDVAIAANRRGSPPGGHFSPYKNPDLADGPAGESLTDRLTQEAASFIRESGQQPWFLLMSHYAVHTPIQAEPTRSARFRAKLDEDLGPGPHNPKYGAMVERTDQSLGALLDLLADLDLEDETLVVFLSDNGGHGPTTSMDPLRGSKGMLFEGGIRVPMVVRWPGRVPAGRQVETPVIGCDLLGTFAAFAGVEAPSTDGVDLSALMLGQVDELDRESLFWHFPAYLEAYRRGGRPFRTRPAGAIRHGNYKLIEWFEDGSVSLFDLSEDPGETVDLSQRRPETVARLRQELTNWRAQVGAGVPDERNPDYDAAADAVVRRR